MIISGHRPRHWRELMPDERSRDPSKQHGGERQHAPNEPTNRSRRRRRVVEHPCRARVGHVIPTPFDGNEVPVLYFFSPGPRVTTLIGSKGNSRISWRIEALSTAMSVAMSCSSERYCLL